MPARGSHHSYMSSFEAVRAKEREGSKEHRLTLLPAILYNNLIN